MKMIRLNSRARIALGQIGLLSSLLLFAGFLGVIPDQRQSIREGRTALAEVFAANSSVLYKQKDISRLKMNMELSVERNEDLLSAALRKVNGRLLVSVGSHDDHWQLKEGEHSTEHQVRIPIWQNNSISGHVELRFHPLAPDGWIAIFHDPLLRLIGFVSLTGFLVFYFYLGRMLKELNPSNAIPARVRSALDTIAGALLIVDGKGNIVLANAAFSQLTGKEPDELVGMDAKSLAWTPLEESSEYVWTGAIRTAQSTRHEKVQFSDSHGKVRSFIVNCSPVMGAGKSPNGVLISMDDVTVLQEQEVQLRKSMEEADQANRAKSAFLSNMSHEIRTPMTAILGFTDVLKRGAKYDEKERQKYLQTISNSGQHLLELINDLLDLSKVESGAMEVESLPCNCTAIVNDVIQVLRVKAVEKGIDLDFSIVTDIPETIIGDPSRLRQVITNLVGNAIKFTDSGRVCIELAVADGLQRNSRNLEIRVVDNGIGMSESQQATIFDAFTQADVSIARRFGGTGLGLSISRQLTLAMGGALSVKSKEGLGSTFTVSLPLADSTVALKSSAEIMASLSVNEQREQLAWELPDSRILVVDDGAENRQLLSIVLSDLNADITLAENGQEALDAVGSNSFDLVLMDIQMPVMDGFEAATAMRQMGITLPIVALTANAMKGFEARILEAGFSHYLTKPIDLEKLTALLGMLLGGTSRVIGESEDNVAEIDSHIPTVTRVVKNPLSSALLSTLGQNDQRFIPIIREFKDRLGNRIEEMVHCLEIGDWAELDELGHWLKGSAGMVGLGPLVEPAVQLQDAAADKDPEKAADLLADIIDMQKRIATESADFDVGASHSASVDTGKPDTDAIATQSHDALPQSDTKAPSAVSTVNMEDTPVHSTLPLHDKKFSELVELFIDRLHEKIDTLQGAVQNKEYKEIAEWAHWLRGSAGNMGFAGFMPYADALEQSAKQEKESIAADYRQVEIYASRVFAGWNQQKT